MSFWELDKWQMFSPLLILYISDIHIIIIIQLFMPKREIFIKYLNTEYYV